MFTLSSCNLSSDKGFVDSAYTGEQTAEVTTPIVYASINSVTEPLDNTYGENASVIFQVIWDKAITVTGTPRIPLTVGAATKYANYTAGTGTTALQFTYTVGAGDTDNDGITALTSVDLNGGTLVGAMTSTVRIDFSAELGSLTNVLVNTAITPPDQVTTINQTNLSEDRTQATFSWTAPSGNGNAVTSYNLRYREVGTSSYTDVTPAPVTNSTTITGLVSGKNYEVQVAAFNGVLGAYSSTLNFTTIFTPASLGALIWVEAKDLNNTGTAPNDNDVVTTIMDKSGNGNNLSYVAGGGNTKATIQSYLGQKVIRLTSSPYRSINSLGETANTDLEVYIVSRTRSITSSFAFVNENEGNNNRYGTHFPWSNGTAYIDIPKANRYSVAWGGNTTDIFAWTFRSSTTQGRALERNGDSITTAGNKSNTAALKKWTFGSRYNGSGNYWQADLLAVFVFDKVLSAQQRTDFFTYIETEYGVDMNN